MPAGRAGSTTRCSPSGSSPSIERRKSSGAPVDHAVFEQLLQSYDEGVAEFLDLERVKPNTLGNSRMLLHLQREG